MVSKKEIKNVCKVLNQRKSVISGGEYRDFTEKEIKKIQWFQSKCYELNDLFNFCFENTQFAPYVNYPYLKVGYKPKDNVLGYSDYQTIMDAPVNVKYPEDFITIMKERIPLLNCFELGNLFRIYKFKKKYQRFEGEKIDDSFSFPELKPIEKQQQEEQQSAILNKGQEFYTEYSFPNYSSYLNIVVDYQPNRKKIALDENGNAKYDEEGKKIYEDDGDFHINISEEMSDCEYFYIMNCYPYSIKTTMLFNIKDGVGYDNLYYSGNDKSFGFYRVVKNNKQLSTPDLFKGQLQKLYDEDLKEHEKYMQQYEKDLLQQLQKENITEEQMEWLIKSANQSFKPSYFIGFEYTDNSKESVFELNLFNPSGFLTQKDLSEQQNILKLMKVYQWKLGDDFIPQIKNFEMTKNYGTKISCKQTKKIFESLNELFQGEFFNPTEYGYSVSYKIRLDDKCLVRSSFYGTVEEWKNNLQ